MLLSVTDYYNLSFERYLYLRTKDFEGYLLFSSISQYTDSITPVRAEVILMN